MIKFLILKKRRDFLRAAKDVTMVAKNVMIQAAFSISPNCNNFPRIGFTATKRLGKAYLRNKTKRRLRAVAREVCAQYSLPNVDYVFVGRANTYCCKYEDLLNDTIWAIKKTNKILCKENDKNEEATNSIN